MNFITRLFSKVEPLPEGTHHMQAQLDELSRGVVEVRRLVFNATVTGLSLFVATRVVGSWRWQA